MRKVEISSENFNKTLEEISVKTCGNSGEKPFRTFIRNIAEFSLVAQHNSCHKLRRNFNENASKLSTEKFQNYH